MLQVLRDLCLVQDKSLPLCCIDDIHLKSVHFKVSACFLHAPLPLGVLGQGVKYLTFTYRPKNKRMSNLADDPRDPLSVGDRKLFLEAIGRLQNLKRLAIPEEFWEELTENGWSDTEPLNHLHGLRIVEAAFCKGRFESVLAYVADGRLVDRRSVHIPADCVKQEYVYRRCEVVVPEPKPRCLSSSDEGFNGFASSSPLSDSDASTS